LKTTGAATRLLREGMRRFGESVLEILFFCLEDGLAVNVLTSPDWRKLPHPKERLLGDAVSPEDSERGLSAEERAMSLGSIAPSFLGEIRFWSNFILRAANL
jgi:hypothetical protein